MRFDAIAITYVVQALLQIAWGIVCYFYSPHNLILAFVNIILLLYTIVSKIVEDEELLITKIYLATWVVPGAYLAFASLANLMSFYTAAGISQSDLPLDGTSHQYIVALKNYFISQLIPVAFMLIRWLVGIFQGES